MRKLKSLIAIILCVFSSLVLCSCGKPSINFNNQSIEMVAGELKDISSLVELEDINLNKVSFSSSNKSVAIITPEKKIGAISAGQAVIEARYQKITAYITVVVLAQKTYLSAPTGLRYDKTASAFVWENVYAQSASGEIYNANSYTVSIQKDNENVQVFSNIQTNSYPVSVAGTYKIKVKTNDRSTLILGSNYCSEIQTTILEKPTNLVFNKETSTLSWESLNTNFEVSVNNVRQSTTNKSVVLSLLNAGAYNLQVFAVGNNVEEAGSEILTITKLTAPTLVVQQGILAWQLEAGTEKFEAIITNSTNQQTIIPLTNEQRTINLENYVAGEYKIKVKAFGLSGYISSDYSQEKTITKLNAPSIEYNPANLTISVLSPITDGVYNLKVANSSSITTISLTSENDYKYVWDKTDILTYTISCTRMSNDENSINSNNSNIITLTQLEKIKLLKHNVVEGKSIVSFVSAQGAMSYEFKTLHNEISNSIIHLHYDEDGHDIGLTNTVFNDSGIFVLSVVASATSEIDGTYFLPSTESIEIKRIANVEATLEAEQITWLLVENNHGYAYELFKDENEIENNTTTSHTFGISRLNNIYGEYVFKIKALGDNKNLLDSLISEEVEFNKDYTLEAPVLTFDRVENTLTLSPVEHASGYIINLNDTLYKSYEVLTEDTVIYIEEDIVNSGEYTFTAKATNVQNELVYDSSIATIVIERLSAPLTINISSAELVSLPTYIDETKLDTNKTEIKINDEIVSNLPNNALNFEIKVKYIAKTTNSTTQFYLDSPVATFNINRLTTPIVPTFNSQKIQWNACSELEDENYKIILAVEQGELKFTIDMGNQTEISATANAIIDDIDLSLPYLVKVYYKVEAVELPTSVFVSSLYSEALEIEKLSMPINLHVIENLESTKILWDAVDNATSYEIRVKLENNEVQTFTSLTNEYAFSFAAVGKYEVQVVAFNEQMITSDISETITVERLPSVSSINYLENQTITINNPVLEAKLEKVLMTTSGEEGDIVIVDGDVSTIDGAFDISIQYIAKVNTSGTQYFLNSETTSYSFTRIAVMQAVTFTSENICWLTNELADKYKLKFTMPGKEDKFVIVDNPNNTISLTSTEIVEIINHFGTGEILISIIALKNDMTEIVPNSTNNVSSITYSPTSTLTNLTAPTNITLIATGDAQTDVVISWEHSGTGIQSYEVYVDDILIETTSAKSISKTDAFTDVKSYSIKVKAVGLTSFISSAFSEEYKFERMASPTNIAISKDGNISWNNILSASSYKMSYKLPEKLAVYVDVENNQNILQYLMNEQNKKINGETIFTIRAVGDATKFLTSSMSENYILTVLQDPTITTNQTWFEVGGTYNEAHNVSIYVSVVYDNGIDEPTTIVDKTKLAVGGTFNVPLTWLNGDYKISAFASSNLEKAVIDSNIVEINQIRLAQATNLSITANENQSSITLIWEHDGVGVAGYEIFVNNEKIGVSTITSYVITNEIANAGIYQLSVMAMGDNGYFNSLMSQTYMVERLSAPLQVSCDKVGKLTWRAIENSTNYEISYAYEEQSAQIQTTTENMLELYSYLLEGENLIAGKITVKIIAVGDGVSYLSSVASEDYDIVVLTKPIITITGDKFTISGCDYEQSDNIKIYVTVNYIDGEEQTVVLNKQVMENGDEYIFPAEWLAGDYELKAYASSLNTHGYIDSQTSTYNFTKLEEVSNISIVATDGKAQKNFTCTWEHDGVGVAGYAIYIDGEYISNATSKTITLNDCFLTAGEHKIGIIAIANENYINSNVKEYNVKRLTFPSEITADKTAKISWTAVEGCDSYDLNYTVAGKTIQTITNATSPYDLYSLILDDEGNVIVGTTLISIVCVGNGTTTLTSVVSSDYELNILSNPVVTLDINKLTVSGNYENQNVKLYLTIKYDNGVDPIETVIDKQVLAVDEEFNYPTTWIAGNYSFECYAQSEDISGFVVSNTTTGSFIKLDAPTQLHFIKTIKENGDYATNFRVTTVDNASGYVMSVNDYSTEAYDIIDTNKLNYEVKNAFELGIGFGNFDINIYSKGGQIGEHYYINSQVSSISATKLAPINKLVVENGVLVWTEMSNITSYTMIVNDEVKSFASDVFESDMAGYSGDLVVNMKAVGNITTEEISENAVLDSSYIGTYQQDYSFLFNNYNCSKLAKTQYLGVNIGYIAVEYNSNLKYKVSASNNKYYEDFKYMGEIEALNMTIGVLYSETMYADFAINTAYTINVQVTTTEQDIIYSDYLENGISVLIPNTVSNMKWKLKVKSYDVNDNPIYDYTSTYINWDDCDTGNGYLLNINNEWSKYDNEEYLPDNEELYPKFEFAVAVCGGSSVDGNGNYILNSNFCSKQTYEFLEETAVSVINGELSWLPIENALGYYVYLNNDLYNNAVVTGTKLSNIEPGVYHVDIMAVTAVENLFPSAKYEYYELDENGEIKLDSDNNPVYVNVRKLDKTSPLLFENGNMHFTEGLSIIEDPMLILNVDNLENYTFTQMPFTYNLINLYAQNLELRFKSINNSQYSTVIDAMNFLSITQSQKDTLAGYGNLTEFATMLLNLIRKEAGWPATQYLLEEQMQLPAGAYSLDYRQNGNNYDYLNSIYYNTVHVYYPNAPKANMIYENSIYYLKWNPISIPVEYCPDAVRYIVYADGYYDNETELSRIAFTDYVTTATQINIKEIVEDENYANFEFKKFYVGVYGDNDNILLGKISNKINVEVLNEVSARIVDGVIEWDSQASASGFEIIFTGGIENETKTIRTTNNFWDCSVLDEGYIYNDVTVMALGSERKQVETFIIAGPVTNIGNIFKLPKPDFYIEDGIFYWEDILNSYDYKIIDFENLVEVSDPTLCDGIVRLPKEDGVQSLYETILGGYRTYLIKTMGSQNLPLGESVTGYVNSNFTSEIYTFKPNKVEEVKLENGILVWDALQPFAENDFVNYKLTFKSETNADLIINLTNISSLSYDGYNVEYEYNNQIYTNLLAGEYSVYLQGYAKGNSNSLTNDINFFEMNNSKKVWALISSISDAFDFEKLVQPEYIAVKSVFYNETYHSGTILWTDPNANADAQFELCFTDTTSNNTISIFTSDEERATEFTYNNGDWTWTGVLDDNQAILTAQSYNLKIRRLAVENNEMTSDYVDYVNTIGDVTTKNIVSQINPINDTIIKMIDINGDSEFVISWENYTPSGVDQSLLTYKFDYYSCKDNEKIGEDKTIYINNGNKYLLYNEINHEDKANMLVYNIQVLIGNSNIIVENSLNSRISKDFTIQTPDSVAQISYNVDSQSFTWEYTNTQENNNLQFIITDYLIDDDANIYDVEDLSEYTKNRYYIAVATGTETYTFLPKEIGSHAISIEVCVANFDNVNPENNANMFKSGMVFYQNAFNNFTSKFDLFDSGNGSSNKPYIIANITQFNNMKYRQTTPSYYTETFNFKQNTNLQVQCGYENNGYVGFISGVFNNIYDGNYYTLTITSSVADINNVGGLFEILGTKAIIKNCRFIANISNNAISNYSGSLAFAIIVGENNGEIVNCSIGNSATINNISITGISEELQFAMVAFRNNGTIKRVVNYYNITLSHNGTIGNQTSINLGVLCCTNAGNILESGNQGNISAVGYEGLTIGGLVCTNIENGYINQSYNNGDITVQYNSSSYSYLVGGLVGLVNNGSIWNSYYEGKITITHNNSNPNEASFGGLVGKSEKSSFINNCYATTNFVVQTIASTINLKYYALVGNCIVNNGNVACYYYPNTTNYAGGNSMNAQYATYDTMLTNLNSNSGSAVDVFEISGGIVKHKWLAEYINNIWKI